MSTAPKQETHDRLRIAQELHDGPLQYLYAIQLQLQLLAALSSAPQTRLTVIQSLVEQTTMALRHACYELRTPPINSHFDLVKARQSTASTTEEEHPYPVVDLHLQVQLNAFPYELGCSLLRIAQEAIRNGVKHASASKIIVSCTHTNDGLLLEIQDDGRGFVVPKDLHDFAEQGHLGIVGSAERATATGASFDIIASPEKGTLVRIMLPIKKPDTEHHDA